MDITKAAQSVFNQPSRSFAVRLWDGTVLPAPQGAVRGEVVFRNPSAITALFPPASEEQIASAFIAGEIEITGDTIDVLDAVARWEGPSASVGARTMVSAWVDRLLSSAPADLVANLRGRQHSTARDRDAVRHHYDVSNDFYRLFLDEKMVYSCGFFPTGLETLESAQRYKLDLICRKLSLKPDERFLDIGCGWGALLFHAGSNYRVRALGVTLSENQLSQGRQRLVTLGERDRIELRAQDYRELGTAGPFDKIASVGMMEHVGRARMDEYFASIFKLLRPGGLFLNHAIADVSSGIRTVHWLPRRKRTFMQQYIFPDTDLIPIGEVIEAAEVAGFEVRDVESLREHYADTLAHWLSRLERRFDEATAIVGQARARTWRLYLAISAVGFRLGRTGVYQLLLAKRLADGRVMHVPRQRARWYEGLLEQPGWQPERDETSIPDDHWRAPENGPSARVSAGGEDGVHPGEPTT
ncbi:MAG TPA: cyclopropane-fatty-acyl-phospholipid synthase family protein [Myxococcaceae bacterium]|nr:cyclopropane-fatty-acyl-phospholipid synthase family protein [Myxococcaceae bacterium]